MGSKILPEGDFRLRDLEGVRAFLETLANSVVTGRLGARETQAASYIAATLVKVIESIGLEDRVGALEAQLKGRLISEDK